MFLAIWIFLRPFIQPILIGSTLLLAIGSLHFWWQASWLEKKLESCQQRNQRLEVDLASVKAMGADLLWQYRSLEEQCEHLRKYEENMPHKSPADDSDVDDSFLRRIFGLFHSPASNKNCPDGKNP